MANRIRKEEQEIWDRVSNNMVPGADTANDSRGDVNQPESDERLTPHARAELYAMEHGVSYEEAVKVVWATMKVQGEVAEPEKKEREDNSLPHAPLHHKPEK